MIGLEYILNLYKTPQVEVAELLEIKTTNVSRWIKGERGIPEKYLDTLSEYFKMPSEYITKQINEVDKIQIKAIKNNKESDIEVNNQIKRVKLLDKIGEQLKNEDLFKLYEKICDMNNESELYKNMVYVTIGDKIVQGIIKENEELKDKLTQIKEMI